MSAASRRFIEAFPRAIDRLFAPIATERGWVWPGAPFYLAALLVAAALVLAWRVTQSA